MSSGFTVGYTRPRLRQAAIRSHTATLEVELNSNSRTDKGSSLNGSSPSRLEKREPGGASKTRNGGLYKSDIVPNDLSAMLHRESD